MFKSNEVEVIDAYLQTTLRGGQVTRLSYKDVYEALGNSVASNVKEVTWVSSLKDLIKAGKFNGIKLSRGRAGGIKLSDVGNSTNDNGQDSVSTKSETSSNDEEDDPDQEEVPESVKEERHVESYHFKKQEVRQVSVKQVPKLKTEIRVGEKLFEVPLPVHQVRALVVNVLELGESSEGNVEYNGTKYFATDDQLALLDKFLFFFFNSSQVIARKED